MALKKPVCFDLTEGFALELDPSSDTSAVGAVATRDEHVTGAALSAGDPVCWDAAGDLLTRGDAGDPAKTGIVGVALGAAAAQAQVALVKRGIARGVLSDAGPGRAYYLDIGGGPTSTPPSGGSARVVRLGWAVNKTDLEVLIQDMGPGA